jgi:hypothetical protein
MNDKPKPSRFSDTQLAVAGLAAGIVLVIALIVVSLVWR